MPESFLWIGLANVVGPINLLAIFAGALIGMFVIDQIGVAGVQQRIGRFQIAGVDRLGVRIDHLTSARPERTTGKPNET